MYYTLIIWFVMMFIPAKLQMEDKAFDVKIEKDEVVANDIVTVTTYTTSESETDSTPLLTASGFKINGSNPFRHRIIAVSRDLKRKYKFGQKVRIRGAGRYDGTYVVRDVMHSRWRKKIDILINPNQKQTKLKRVKMYKID